MTVKQFLRTLNFRIMKINLKLESSSSVHGFKTIDSRYSSPVTNPFFSHKPNTVVWVEKNKSE